MIRDMGPDAPTVENDWRKIGTRDHVNHAIAHMYAYLLGDRSDDHLGHALCRAMFAVAMEDGE